MRSIAVITICVAAWSCRGSDNGSMVKPSERVSLGASSHAATVPNPHHGTEPRVVQRDTVSLFSPPWTVTRALEMLRAANLNPTIRSANVSYPAIPIPGTSVAIQSGQVQLFIFGDANSSAAAATAFANSVTAHTLVRNVNSARPVILSADNLLAVVIASDTAVVHKVRDALTRRHILP